jgi:NAD(P)-dependent dehydrogenase (short-subunit alcohol dehydrogenase family)
MDLNLRSVFLFSRAVIVTMRQQKFGRIVNLSSVLAHGEKGPPTTVAARLPYATAKAAILGFTKQLAKDEAEFGITVNALSPGLILGEPGTRIRDRFDAMPPEQRAGMLHDYPVGRAGEGAEVSAAIAFLVSDAAGYVTGVELPVDGGYL